MPRHKSSPEAETQRSSAPVIYEQHSAAGSGRQTFKKAHEAIFLRPLRGKLTLAVRKGYNVLIKRAQESGVDQDEFVIHNRAFVAEAQADTNNYEFLKDLGRRYVSTLVEWDAMSEAGRRRWGVAALLSRWEIVDGEIIFAFDKRIKERLLNPDIYARISLSMQGRFRSSIALALYEICARYATNPSHLTQRRPWAEWRDLLCGGEANSYGEFRYFNRVLKRAIVELNAVSDLDVQCTIFKSGRNVTDLQFKISEKQQSGLEFGDPNILNSDLSKKLVEIGLKPKSAIKVLTTHDEAAIEAALLATKKRADKKGAEPLGNAAAYFLSLLKDGHYSLPAGVMPPSAEPSREEKATATREAMLSSLYDLRAKEAEGLFNEIAEPEQQRVIGEFVDAVVSQNNALAAAFKKNGVRSVVVRKALFRWFGDRTWGVPTDTDLLNYAMQKGVPRA